MRRSSEIAFAGALLLAPAAGAAPARPAAPGPALGRLIFVERRAELSSAQRWEEVKEGAAVRLGNGLRTTDAVARVELPWMTMTLGPNSAVRFPDEYLLSVVLDRGRVQLRADQRSILKLVTAEAEVRGQGWAVVRREGRQTLVTSLAGRFLVAGAGRTVSLIPGTGTIVHEGRPPLPPLLVPDPPGDLSPGSDPRYVARGEAISLAWAPRGTAYQVEVLPVGSDDVLLQRDVDGPPARISIPWPGAFRWRVASRDARGVEGMPSADGLFCVEK
jgi:hypothetical protein